METKISLRASLAVFPSKDWPPHPQKLHLHSPRHNGFEKRNVIKSVCDDILSHKNNKMQIAGKKWRTYIKP